MVRDTGQRRRVLLEVGSAARALGTAVLGYASSGLPGPKGNRETFVWLGEGTRDRAAGIDLKRAVGEVEP